MASIQISEWRVRLTGDLPEGDDVPSLRNVFGESLARQVYAWNRSHADGPLSQYPRVQFKLIDDQAILWAMNEGAELVRRLRHDMVESTRDEATSLDGQFELREEEIDATGEPHEYRFITPWLALNEKNFRSYTGSRNTKLRKDELSRILVGNCLGIAKSLETVYCERIGADCRGLTSVKTWVNGKGMIGFVGKFKLNMLLPELIGLGKSVAQGFGAVSTEAF